MREMTFQVQVPEDVLNFGYGQEEIQKDVNEWLVLSLFTEGHVSSGKAANLLGMTRVQFLRLLRKRGIAYVDYESEELQEEIHAAMSIEMDTDQ